MKYRSCTATVAGLIHRTGGTTSRPFCPALFTECMESFSRNFACVCSRILTKDSSFGDVLLSASVLHLHNLQAGRLLNLCPPRIGGPAFLLAAHYRVPKRSRIPHHRTHPLVALA